MMGMSELIAIFASSSSIVVALISNIIKHRIMKNNASKQKEISININGVEMSISGYKEEEIVEILKRLESGKSEQEKKQK